MNVTERSRERLESLAERLEAEYGPVSVVEKTWRHPAGMYEHLVERFEEGWAGGAGAWVYDDDGRVLLVREEGRTAWTDPGDKRDPGESFEESARRSVRERAGIAASITGVLELHEVEVYDGTDPDRPHLFEAIVVFSAVADGDTPSPGEGVEEVQWFERHPPVTQYENVEDRPIPFDPE